MDETMVDETLSVFGAQRLRLPFVSASFCDKRHFGKKALSVCSAFAQRLVSVCGAIHGATLALTLSVFGSNAERFFSVFESNAERFPRCYGG